MKKRRAKKIKVRRTWRIKPITKVKESNKLYSRRRSKRKLRKRLEKEGLIFDGT
ncbi:MAG: hypothetical protein HQ593_02900 [Candidatus Omnitrophica bacterium]|nr:hypothetical protein [Candidatus Omnitrophota bacterium]